MEQAEATYREAIALFRETLDDNNFYVINATLQLAQLLITIGNTSEAERLLAEAAANAENKHLHLAAEATKLLTQLHERNQQEDQSGQ
jgi:thioredoxin-like negative regulator of GroEL